MGRLTGGPTKAAIHVRTVLIALCYALWGAVSQAGDAADSDHADLVRQRRDKLVTGSPDAIAASRKSLANAVARLNASLSRDGKNGAAWKRYLLLDDLAATIHTSNAEPSDDTLQAALKRSRSDFPGLERPVCQYVASALEQYIRIAGKQARTVTEEEVAQKLDLLSQQLAELGASPSPESIGKVAEQLGWLTDRGIETELVAEVRARLSQPNLRVQVSQELIESGSLRRIDDAPRPVRDVILGTNIVGTGRTTGWVRTRLLPDSGRALLETTITATNRAQTVGYNGPARIGSTSTTQLSGAKRFYLDPTGFHVWQACSCAEAHSQICGIWSNKHGVMDRIVRRVASKRAAQQKRTAEQIASRHAESQLNARVDVEANAQLGRAHADFLSKIRNPLLRVGQWPRQLQMRSTGGQFQLVALHDSSSHLASPLPAPALTESATMAVQFHESLINNYGDGLLAGRTLHQVELDKLSLQLFGRRPKQLAYDEEKGPWEITFANLAPVVLRVDGGRASLTVRGRRFGSEVRTIETPLDVTAHYKLVRENNAAKAIREGDDIEVYPTGFVPGGDRKMSLRQSRDASYVRNRFDDFFTPEITSQGLVLPGQWAQAGRLELVELTADHGWVTLAWRQAAGEVPSTTE
jgi:hypothetical protein